MKVIKVGGYGKKRYHRMNDDGTLACGSGWRSYTIVDDSLLRIRQLCGNCFKVRNLMASVRPDSREVDLVTIGK